MGINKLFRYELAETRKLVLNQFSNDQLNFIFPEISNGQLKQIPAFSPFHYSTNVRNTAQ